MNASLNVRLRSATNPVDLTIKNTPVEQLFENKESESANKLRIAFFNASDRGSGAEALICNTIQALLARGIEARLYVKARFTGAPYVHSLPRWPGEREIERLFRFIFGRNDFLFPSTYTMCLDPWIRNAHLWHFHNLHGHFVSIPLLAALSRKRLIVLSPVDQFLSTGYCPYTIGCERYRDKCGLCVQLKARYQGIDRDSTSALLAIKKSAIAKSRFHLLVHTDYLARHYNSTFVGARPMERIHYGVNTKVFRPMDREICASALGIRPLRQFVVGLLHGVINDKRKAIIPMLEIMRSRVDGLPIKIDVLVVGHASELAQSYAGTHMSVTALPFLESEQELAMALNLCDVILYPTQADNLSLTCLSALACGVPVISSNVGGQGEAIHDGVNGFLVEPNRSDLMLDRVMQMAIDPVLKRRLSIQARENAVSQFDINDYGINLVDYYMRILGYKLHE